ncbi:MAG: glycosyltransferase [Chloroflexi bacterium]|nr:glycosyltransferase [Chloroflexota bacterium]
MSKKRFVSLGAATLWSLAWAVTAFKALQEPDKIPPVNALQSAAPGGGEWPFVSVIVPARNEERNLPRLLPSLLSQRYPEYEVIVVDDQSEDATARIVAEWSASDKRLRAIEGAELPRREGWLGKPHAMHQGANAARGAFLLFTDADTVHAKLSLSSSVAYALAHNVDLLTITPCAELLSPSERLLMPLAFEGIVTLYPPYKVNDPASSVAIANGQYMLVRREVYDAVGGAGRVKDKIAEDLEFGKAVKSDGYRLYLANGAHLMTVRMYTNFREVWEGWSKNVVLSFKENPRTGFFAVVGLLSVTVMPFLLVKWSLRAWQEALKSGNKSHRLAAGWITGLAAWNIALPLIFRRRADRSLGLPVGWTFTQPVGAVVFSLIILNSLLRLARGKGVVWKGRSYGTRD